MDFLLRPQKVLVPLCLNRVFPLSRRCLLPILPLALTACASPGASPDGVWYTLVLTIASIGTIAIILLAFVLIYFNRRLQTAVTQRTAQLTASEQNYHRLFDNNLDAILVADDDGRYIDVNPAACQLLGYTRAELLSKSFFDIIDGDERPSLQASWQRFIDGGTLRGSVSVQRKDGTIIQTRYQAVANFTPGRHLATIRDVTERQQAEEKLQESEKRYRLLFQNAPIGIAYCTLEGKIIAINDLGAANSERRTEDMIGSRLHDLYGPEVGSLYQERIQTAAQSDESLTFSDVFTFPKGEVWWDTILSRLTDREGRVTGVQIIATNATAARQAEAALRESEELHRITLENISDLIFITDRDGRFTFISPNSLPTLGYQEEENQILHNITQLFADPPLPLPEILTAAHTVHRLERHYVTQSGEQRHFLIDIKPVAIKGGSLLFSCRDITDRKAAEAEREALIQQIQTQAQLLQNIIDSVPEGFLLLSSDGTILLTNPTAREHLHLLTGSQEPGIITHLGGRPLAALLSPPPSGSFHELRPASDVFEVAAQPFATPLTGDGWLLLVRHVTQDRERQKAGQQQERLAAIGQLAAGIAHDFNNILAVISLYTELLLQKPTLPAEARDPLQTIFNQTHKASELIQQILDFGRRTPLNPQPTDLRTLLENTVTLLRRTLPATITLTLVADHYQPIVKVDTPRFQQAILNLALNARDAMPDGGEITFKLTPVQVGKRPFAQQKNLTPGSWVRLEVQDGGDGIPETVMPHIFEPFFTTKAPKGAGLGLAQVYGIIKQHGGEINVVSSRETGAKFSIYLPELAQAAPTQPESAPAATLRGRGQTLLVVEDQDTVRQTLADVLQSLNYEVLTAVNGQEAVTLYDAESDRIDLVLSDMVMPVMGGKALYHALHQRDPHVKFIILSGYASIDELKELLDGRHIHWLAKPPELQQLSNLVAKLLA